jgi:filamentous hemagglutinin
MRARTIEDSKKFAGVVDSTGKVLSNMTGESEGIRGDGVKAGGTRVDLDLLCGANNERCTFETKSDGSIDNGKSVQFNGSFDDFMKSAEGQKMSGPTGGVQGFAGTLFGEPYFKGSWQDKLIEAFAGTHDMIGGKASGLYNEQGVTKRGMSSHERTVYDYVVSPAALLPTIPFAAAQGLSPEVWNAISILLKASK